MDGIDAGDVVCLCSTKATIRLDNNWSFTWFSDFLKHARSVGHISWQLFKAFTNQTLINSCGGTLHSTALSTLHELLQCKPATAFYKSFIDRDPRGVLRFLFSCSGQNVCHMVTLSIYIKVLVEWLFCIRSDFSVS